MMVAIGLFFPIKQYIVSVYNSFCLGAVQLLCNPSRGRGDMSKYDFVLYGGRGGEPKYDFVLCDVGIGVGGKSKYDFVLCNVRRGGGQI